MKYINLFESWSNEDYKSELNELNLRSHSRYNEKLRDTAESGDLIVTMFFDSKNYQYNTNALWSSVIEKITANEECELVDYCITNTICEILFGPCEIDIFEIKNLLKEFESSCTNIDVFYID